MKRYCGRDFGADELLAVTQLIAQNPTANRAELSRQLCVLLDWFKPNGGLKDMTCRVAMLRMQADGLITLPPSQWRPRRRPEFLATAATNAQPLLAQPVHELAPLHLRQVAGPANSRLWNEYIARYHYLGYTPMAGSRLFLPNPQKSKISPTAPPGSPLRTPCSSDRGRRSEQQAHRCSPWMARR
ncbi:MAG: hypothetical protein AW09_000869 [Candidatus Accumulibacter phosphatis]|uniref:Uncharacterized protein n=1 Tax=Candidatus Accumulibacter phosphatis TaxID=327160 RepID=A0A080M0J3_9PROT|nr:MAG: hypothetical protein AW09_000869 [Candidatus Accumulibacter phosphatis]